MTIMDLCKDCIFERRSEDAKPCYFCVEGSLFEPKKQNNTKETKEHMPTMPTPSDVVDNIIKHADIAIRGVLTLIITMTILYAAYSFGELEATEAYQRSLIDKGYASHVLNERTGTIEFKLRDGLVAPQYSAPLSQSYVTLTPNDGVTLIGRQ